MPGSCSFNNLWLRDKDFQQWIAPHPKLKTMAVCTACESEFDIANNGIAAVRSHAKGTKHAKNVKAQTTRLANPKIGDFFVTSQPSTDPPTPAEGSSEAQTESSETVPAVPESASTSTSSPSVKTCTCQCCRKKTALTDFVQRDKVLKAETLWALKTVASHLSFKCSNQTPWLFASMFEDSPTASKFTMSEKKCAYLTTFGLAPHFSSVLKERAKTADGFVLLFDEALNEELQKKQLDVHVRFWDDSKVSTRYFGSHFMGHATAEDLFEELLPQCHEFGLGKLIQISMDGPNVNLKLHGMMQEQILRDHDMSLLNVGSCGLHTIHNAFKTGHAATGWDLQQWMNSLHWLFKDSSARRADFMKYTGAEDFPLQYCSHRWLENVRVAERGLELWPHLKEFVQAVKSGNIPQPKGKSYKTIEGLSLDPLFEAKVQAFLSVAKILNPFLKKFQGDAPLLPFMCNDIIKILKVLLERCVKAEVLEKLTTPAKYAALDFNDKTIYLQNSKIDPGFVAASILKDQMAAKKVNERLAFSFRDDVKNFLVAVIKKIVEKSPLKFGLARNMGWLVPSVFVDRTKREKTKSMLKNCLQLLSDAKRLPQGDIDEVMSQFSEFFDEAQRKISTFNSFQQDTDWLDVFWSSQLATSSLKKLWLVVKMLLVLSHGQASVERGFSVSKQLMEVNMGENTIVAQRVVMDHIKHVGGISKVDISKKLLFSASQGRQRYQHYLDQKKEEAEKQKKGEKRKRELDEVENLKTKRKRMEESLQALVEDADSFARKAEDKNDLRLLAKSNALRKSAKDKQEQLKGLNAEINDKLNALANA